MTEQDNRPAWEQLCPELPPNRAVSRAGGAWEVWNRKTGERERLHVLTRAAAVDFAWRSFGITRRDYAELIAHSLVREAAEAAFGGEPFSIKETEVIGAFGCDGESKVAIRISRPCGYSKAWRGLTYCDAALAVIRSLGGGE